MQTNGEVRLRRPRWGIAAVAGLLAAAGVVEAHVAAAPVVVARYEMNEGGGASRMTDSSGFNLHGTIQSGVQTGVNVQGATGYRWSNTSPTDPPAKPERIVRVPDNSRLDPGSGRYVVEFRYRTTRSFGNVIQKGQNKTSGGYFKFEQPNGNMTCLFKGGNGQQRAVKSPVATNDGNWHTIKCERTASGLKLWVDGTLVRQLSGPTGTISNSKPLAIGGKLECDQVSVTCDYFVGDIDWVRITKG